jgi:hypothetical protein
MATTTARWGNTPLTAEGIASLGRPLSLDDFNQDAGGYWRTIRGEKTYYPREWFDQAGTFTGTGTQAGDKAGQGQGFFKQGTKWNWKTGQWENPTNWANVIGVAAAGGVGAGIAAPAIGAALGGSATTAGGVGPLAGGYGAATTSAAVPSSLAAVGGGTVASYLTPTTIGDLIKGGTSIYGTIAQSGAQKDATEAQAAAAKYAADVKAKSDAEQLAFLRQQAGYDASAAEVNRAGNYDQWAARQELLGPVGQALGLPARRIPAYVPLPANPYGTGSPTPTPTGPGTAPPTGGTSPPPTTTGAPGVSAANGDIASQVAAYYKARGVTPNPTSVDYWASKWNEFGAKDPEYFNRRLSQADEFGGGGGAAPAPAAADTPRRYQPLGDVGSLLSDPNDPLWNQTRPVMRPYYAGPVGSYLA